MGWFVAVLVIMLFSVDAHSTTVGPDLVAVVNDDSTISYVPRQDFARAREIDSIDQLIAHSNRKKKKAEKEMDESGTMIFFGIIVLGFFWIVKRFGGRTKE